MGKTYGDSELYNQRDIDSIAKRLEAIRNDKIYSVNEMVALMGIANYTYVRIVKQGMIRKCTPKMIRSLLEFLEKHEAKNEC